MMRPTGIISGITIIFLFSFVIVLCGFPANASDEPQVPSYFKSASEPIFDEGDLQISSLSPIERLREKRDVRIRYYRPQFIYGYNRNPLLENRDRKTEPSSQSGDADAGKFQSRNINYRNPPFLTRHPGTVLHSTTRTRSQTGFRGSNIFYGIASWYGRKFHGRRTSNGEIYNMYKLTAAHRELPFNTYVRATNLRNGRSTIVRINDRGPFVPGREIDLSYRAAYDLGMVDTGLEEVRLEIVGNATD